MNRPAIDAHMLRHERDCALTYTEQPDDRLAHFNAGRRSFARLGRLKHFRCITRHPGVGVRVGHRQIASGAHDSIEVVAELDIVSEDALMYRTVRGRIVGEADATRCPIRPEQRAQDAECNSHRQLRRLPDRPGVSNDQLLAQHDDVPTFLHRQEERFVELLDVTQQRFERQPDRRLLPD